MCHRHVHLLPCQMVNVRLVCKLRQLLLGQIFTHTHGIVSYDHEYAVTGEFQLALCQIRIGRLYQIEPGAHGEVTSYKALEEGNPRAEELGVRDVRIQLFLQVLPKGYRFHVAWHFHFGDWAEMPGLWVPFSDENSQSLPLGVFSALVSKEFVWLMDLHVEVLIVE